jgi:hypothetical protein
LQPNERFQAAFLVCQPIVTASGAVLRAAFRLGANLGLLVGNRHQPKGICSMA